MAHSRAMVNGAEFGARTPIVEFMPRLRGTALEARVPVTEHRA